MLKEFKTLLPYAKRFTLWYIAGLVCLVVTDGGLILVPQFIRRAIDIIVSGDFQLVEILRIAGSLCGIALIVGLSRFGWRFFIHGASRRIEMMLRDRLFRHLQVLSSSFYSRTKTGDLMARFTNDMNAIRMASGMGLVALIDGVFMALVILVILISQNARIAVLTILPLPVITVAILLLGKTIGERFRQVQEGFARLSERVQESISGIRVIKTFVREKYFIRKFSTQNEEYVDRQLSLVKIWGLFFPVVTFIAGITNVIFLVLGGSAVMSGELSAGDFTAFLSYLQMLIWPMMGMGFTVNLIQRGGASLGRINRVLEEVPDIADPAEPKPPGSKGDITIKGLTYSYPDSSTPTLNNISLHIPSGSILGILGKTGAGKTTLVNLLPRMINPPEGTIFLDGVDIKEMKLAELRNSFAVVPQDIFLFSASVSENIGFGLDDEEYAAGEDHSTGKIRETAEASTITRDAENFPEGLETVIGERGVTLSGGQKQRIAIARALSREAPVLIFDDSFSSVDTDTENTIQKNIASQIKGKTVILISHRTSTLKIADSIIVLEDGRITEEGTHEELISAGGFYQEIYTLQQLEEQLEESR